MVPPLRVAENNECCWDMWFRRSTVVALESEDSCLWLSMMDAATVAAKRLALCRQRSGTREGKGVYIRTYDDENALHHPCPPSNSPPVLFPVYLLRRGKRTRTCSTCRCPYKPFVQDKFVNLYSSMELGCYKCCNPACNEGKKK